MSTATAQAPTSTGGNRWLILAGGVLVQLTIGAVYAWSTFSKAIQADSSAIELTKVQATIPFEVAIGMLFLGTFLVIINGFWRSRTFYVRWFAEVACTSVNIRPRVGCASTRAPCG